MSDRPTLTDDEIRALLHDATPGRWHVGYHACVEVQSARGVLLADCGPIGTAAGDARLMAAAPTLAAEVLSLRARVAALDKNRREVAARAARLAARAALHEVAGLSCGSVLGDADKIAADVTRTVLEEMHHAD